MRHALRAFRHRNFRLFFAGQGTSQIGTWLQLIAVSWMVQRLTGSAWMLGVAAFALHAPFLLLTPFAGVIVDRLDRRRVLAVTNGVAATQSIVLLVLVATGQVQVWHLVIGNLVLGASNAFDAPARQSLLVQLVGGRDDLPNAIALNSSMMNAARFVGPMIGGAVIAGLGERWGFALNSLSYVAMLAALYRLRLAPKPAARDDGTLLERLATGVRFVFGFLPTRVALLTLAAVALCVAPYQSLMPWFAARAYGGGSETLGLLLGASGLGAVTGMLYLASRPSIRGLFRVIAVAALTSGLALIAFAQCETLWLGLSLVYLIGGGQMLAAASTNTVLQSIVPDELRARVASLYVMSFVGMGPLGSLLGGWVGEHFGPRAALTAGGFGVLLVVLVYVRQLPAIREAIRPVYQRLGIAADSATQ